MNSKLHDANKWELKNGGKDDDDDVDTEEDDNDAEDLEEEEEEDMDFNPFLKDTPSPDASSSLSSEVEVGQVDAGSTAIRWATCGERNEVQSYAGGYSEQGEVILNPNACEKNGNACDDGYVDDEEEDAICKRTRARYSLASFTLDELETFLQESDDEDDLRNVDDEEEYRKFLTAVLQGTQDGCGVELPDEFDEEENDADFEIELEELLESDADEEIEKIQEKMDDDGRELRRPQTRQNRRQIASVQYEKRLLEQTKRPLRPLLPILPNAGLGACSLSEGNSLMPFDCCGYTANSGSDGLINGFTPQQIGKLHNLIYEHVQLLIQVFSLTVFDVSRQHVASQVQNLLSELLQKRDEGITNRSSSYPDICFSPPYLVSSVTDEIPNSAVNNQRDNFQGPAFWWAPSISRPVSSVLDVAPLNYVETYLKDVSNVMHEHKVRQLSVGSDFFYEKEPLFNCPNISSWTSSVGEGFRGEIPSATSNLSLGNGQQQVKKTLAASIVEKVKKESIACVPKDISKLAQRFTPLFNPTFFPHKPLLVANRILFTDAEDELLARGILEFNNDWKAIQQHFLPCKSEHQIFVRQKNRSSSKALENPIKAVRRMKSSPLTADEIERIHEGLRVFKSDWTSVWRFVVPYRDPSLLPRLWRIACGSQKSYKSDAAKNEKRRLYDSERRLKQANLARCKSISEKENSIACMNEEKSNSEIVAESYVHQAFLADWRPGGSDPYSTHNTRDSNGCLIDPIKETPQDEQLNKLSQNLRPTDFPFSTTPGSAKHSKSTTLQSIYPLPQNGSTTGGSRVVRLAPDLPLVNLPPSVRVISQPDFRHSKNMQSAMLPVSAKVVSSSSKGAHHTANIADGLSSSSASISGIHITEKSSTEPHERIPLEDSMMANVSYGMDERCSDSVMEMHPLLFQPSEAGDFHYPSSSMIGNSHSFSFISRSQVELNLSLFDNPLQSSKADTSSTSIGFHPLLQRSTDIHNTSFSKGKLDSETKCERSDSFKHPLGEDSCQTGRECFVGSNNDEIGDTSHLGIVMEQEELSDSDEDVENHVEFECEEMDDSEGDEESQCETYHGQPNMDASCNVSKKLEENEDASLKAKGQITVSSEVENGLSRPSRSCRRSASHNSAALRVLKRPRKRG